MAPSGIRGLNAWLLSSPGDIGIIGGASAFDGLALAVARCGRRTQVVMKVNVSKPPARSREAAWVCREAGPPSSSSSPRMSP